MDAVETRVESGYELDIPGIPYDVDDFWSRRSSVQSFQSFAVSSEASNDIIDVPHEGKKAPLLQGLLTKAELLIITRAKENKVKKFKEERKQEKGIQLDEREPTPKANIIAWRENTFDMTSIRNLLKAQKTSQVELLYNNRVNQHERNKTTKHDKMQYKYGVRGKVKLRTASVAQTEDEALQAPRAMAKARPWRPSICHRFIKRHNSVDVKRGPGFSRVDFLKGLPLRLSGKSRKDRRAPADKWTD
jgi:hypothetical protein